MTDDEHATRLRELETRYRQAFDMSEQARQDRNQYVRKLVNAGWTHARVSDAAGFSRARVAQIAPRKRQGKAPA